MLTLISNDVTYEKKWKLDDEPEDKWPIFTLRKLSSGQVNAIDDATTITAKKGARIQFLGGTARRLKIDVAVVDWKHVIDQDGSEAKCTTKTKEELPAEIQSWLEEDINKVNRLDTRGLEDDERKNL